MGSIIILEYQDSLNAILLFVYTERRNYGNGIRDDVHRETY